MVLLRESTSLTACIWALLAIASLPYAVLSFSSEHSKATATAYHGIALGQNSNSVSFTSVIQAREASVAAHEDPVTDLSWNIRKSKEANPKANFFAASRELITQSRSLWPRITYVKSWGCSVATGQRILNWLTEWSQPESQWSNYQEFGDDGWASCRPDPFPSDYVDNALNGLGLPTDSSAWTPWCWKFYSMAEGALRYGRVMAWLLASEGAVIIGNSASPSPPPPNTQDPAPYRMSDVAIIAWKLACQQAGVEDLASLRYIIEVDVTNPGAIEAMETAVGGTRWSPWPGKEFSIDTESGQGLLGCPNGLGIGLMIAQHRSIFQPAGLSIKSITVWNTNLLFKLQSS